MVFSVLLSKIYGGSTTPQEISFCEFDGCLDQGRARSLSMMVLDYPSTCILCDFSNKQISSIATAILD
jgi:hypothetical protein